MTPQAAIPIDIQQVWAFPATLAPRVPDDDPFPADYWERVALDGAEAAPVAPPTPVTHPGGMLTVSREFLTAGEAIFTVVPDPSAPWTRPHYTYKITRKDGERGRVYFISTYITSASEDREDAQQVGALAHADRQSPYAWSYMGLLVAPAAQRLPSVLKLTAKSTFAEGSGMVQILTRALDAIAVGRAPLQWQILHSGACGRCGRTLTHPESLTTGIGPECTKLLAEGK